MDEIVMFVTNKEYFFSMDHLQRYKSSIKLDEKWVPHTFYLPYTVKPRPGIPTGIITDKEGMIILHDDLIEVPNPDPEFQG